VRAALEELMASGNYEFQSDFVKKFLAQGRSEGEAKGKGSALIAVLEARGVRISDEARARIVACTDAAQLEVWLRKAATASTVDEVF
jgi:hypothetical protein